MFGLSLAHLILFGVILLIFVGPEQLPEVARTIARVLNELKRATSDFQSQFTNHIDPHRPWEAKPPVNSQPQPPAHPPALPQPPPVEVTEHDTEVFQPLDAQQIPIEPALDVPTSETTPINDEDKKS